LLLIETRGTVRSRVHEREERTDDQVGVGYYTHRRETSAGLGVVIN